MGPNKNYELFNQVAAEVIPSIDEEYLRRNLVAPTLAELSDLFDRKDNTPNPVIEPTLFARLYALSMVQRSRMGISGFDPLSAFDYDGKVEAKAAVPHDAFKSADNGSYHTRVIKFMLPNQYIGNEISIFGLNIYQPNIDDEPVDMSTAPYHTEKGFVVVDNRGSVTKRKRPISGETVVFAVHNKITKDAKLYQVGLEPADVTASMTNYAQGSITFENEMVATVLLPDNRRVRVSQLHGIVQNQAEEELRACSEILKGIVEPNSVLTESEQYAARTVINGASD